MPVIILTARGVVNAVELAQVPDVTRLAFGVIDSGPGIAATAETASWTTPGRKWSSPPALPALRRPLYSRHPHRRYGGADSAMLARNFSFGGELIIHPAQLADTRGVDPRRPKCSGRAQ